MKHTIEVLLILALIGVGLAGTYLMPFPQSDRPFRMSVKWMLIWVAILAVIFALKFSR
jgi:hypothetical protein